MMIEYPKIQSIFKRDLKTHKFIGGDYSCPEFEYLKDCIWRWTEKIDGTNIRVHWSAIEKRLTFLGRTDNAQIPPFLETKLWELFKEKYFIDLYPEVSMCLYGEGYGARINKGGKYIADGVDFILFDIVVDNYWLTEPNILDIASKLGIETVPPIGVGTLSEAINIVKDGLQSRFGDFEAEGLVLKSQIQLFDRKGNRIITKMKHKDFNRKEVI